MVAFRHRNGSQRSSRRAAHNGRWRFRVSLGSPDLGSDVTPVRQIRRLAEGKQYILQLRDIFCLTADGGPLERRGFQNGNLCASCWPPVTEMVASVTPGEFRPTADGSAEVSSSRRVAPLYNTRGCVGDCCAAPPPSALAPSACAEEGDGRGGWGCGGVYGGRGGHGPIRITNRKRKKGSEAPSFTDTGHVDGLFQMSPEAPLAPHAKP